LSALPETISIEPKNTRGWPKTKQQLDFAVRIVQYGDSMLEAAIAVGYSKTYAHSSSHVLAKKLNPFIVFLQEKKNETAAKKFDVTTDRVLREMAAIGLQNWKDYVTAVEVDGVPYLIGKPLNELTDLQALAVQSWSIEEVECDDGTIALDYRYVLHDKSNALLNLGKHLGMFSEKLMLDLNMRKSQSKAIDFSALPQDKLADVIKALEKIKSDAAEARTIEGSAKELSS